MNTTNEMLRNLEYKDLKKKFTGTDRVRLIENKCVSIKKVAPVIKTDATDPAAERKKQTIHTGHA